MKKIITLLAVAIIATSVFAQAPKLMSYQAVIRNSSGVLVTNTSVGMQISILQDSATGSPVYVETQSVLSNANGLVSLQIGNGAVVLGAISIIDWGHGSYYIKTETDPSGGTSYSITGTSQLLSVPYALYAGSGNNTAGSGISISGDTITNAAPDQIVSVTGTGNTSVSGNYPNFSINTPSAVAGSGISIVGDTINNASPDQTVTLIGTGNTSVLGTYPNFTVNNPKPIAGAGIAISGDTISNAAPDQTVTITGSGVATVTGTYPNFNVDADITPALPKFISNVDLVPMANTFGSTSFTNIDVSPYVPFGSKYAILYVLATAPLYIDFRKDSISASLYTGHLRIFTNSNINQMQLIVPLNSVGTFEYYYGPLAGPLVDQGALNIKLVGYY